MPIYKFMVDGVEKRINADSKEKAVAKLNKAYGLRQDAKKDMAKANDPYLEWEDMTGGEKFASVAAPFGSEVARRGGSPSEFMAASVGDAAATFIPGMVASKVAAGLAPKVASPLLRGAAAIGSEMLASGAAEGLGQYAFTGEIDPLSTGAATILPGAFKGAGQIGKSAAKRLKGVAPEVLKYSLVPNKRLREQIPLESFENVLDEGLVPIMGGARKLNKNIENVVGPMRLQQGQSIQDAVDAGVSLHPEDLYSDAFDYINDMPKMSTQDKIKAKRWILDEIDSYIKENGLDMINPEQARELRQGMSANFDSRFVEEPAVMRAKEGISIAVNEKLKDVVPDFRIPTEGMRPYMGVADASKDAMQKRWKPLQMRDFLALGSGAGAGGMVNPYLAVPAGLGLAGMNRLTTTVGGSRLLNEAGKAGMKLSDPLAMGTSNIARMYGLRPQGIQEDEQ